MCFIWTWMCLAGIRCQFVAIKLWMNIVFCWRCHLACMIVPLADTATRYMRQCVCVSRLHTKPFKSFLYWCMYILCVRVCLLNKTDHRCPHRICIQIFSGTHTKLLTFWHTEKKITTILYNRFPNSLCLLPLWVKC